jgi:A/G-specific adenine glycosylase
VPGVGLYTASAVLSIAHGLALPVVDGNVRRVLARLLALRGPAFRKDGPYYNRAEELLDLKRPGDWNQALMELGATICLPRKPACPVCPLRQRCEARAHGLVEELPESRARRAPVDVTVAAALVERDGRVLLVRRPEGRLMGRMWEVPQTSLDARGRPDLAREIEERHGIRVVPGPLTVRARHAVTYRRITLEGYSSRLRSAPSFQPPVSQPAAARFSRFARFFSASLRITDSAPSASWTRPIRGRTIRSWYRRTVRPGSTRIGPRISSALIRASAPHGAPICRSIGEASRYRPSPVNVSQGR